MFAPKKTGFAHAWLVVHTSEIFPANSSICLKASPLSWFVRPVIRTFLEFAEIGSTSDPDWRSFEDKMASSSNLDKRSKSSNDIFNNPGMNLWDLLLTVVKLGYRRPNFVGDPQAAIDLIICTFIIDYFKLFIWLIIDVFKILTFPRFLEWQSCHYSAETLFSPKYQVVSTALFLNLFLSFLLWRYLPYHCYFEKGERKYFFLRLLLFSSLTHCVFVSYT